MRRSPGRDCNCCLRGPGRLTRLFRIRELAQHYRERIREQLERVLGRQLVEQ
jgi:hypothetical protein